MSKNESMSVHILHEHPYAEILIKNNKPNLLKKSN